MTDNDKDQENTNQKNTEDTNADLALTAEEEEMLKKKIEELRKRDPFIYR